MAHLPPPYSQVPSTTLSSRLSSPCSVKMETDADGPTPSAELSEIWCNLPSDTNVPPRRLQCANLWGIEAPAPDYAISPSRTSSESVTENPFEASFCNIDAQASSAASDLSRPVITPVVIPELLLQQEPNAFSEWVCTQLFMYT